MGDSKLDKMEIKIILLLKEYKKVSRQQLALELETPLPTVTKIVDGLIKKKLIVEIGYGLSTGGRRPSLLSLNADAYYSIGIALGRSEIKLALINLNGDILNLQKQKWDPSEDAEMIFEFIGRAIADIFSKPEFNKEKILGVGVGLPGPVKINGGVVTTPTYFNGKPFPLVRKLKKLIDVPVIIEKNANTAALSEKWFGHGIKKNHFIYVLANVGVGCGLVINKVLYKGDAGEAGGLGHTTIDIFGEKCTCGNYGCVETLVSTRKVEENVKRKLKLDNEEHSYFYDEVDIDQIDFNKIVQSYRSGSVIAKQELELSGKYLGVAIANIVGFYNPEIIILGGNLGEISVVIDMVRSSLHSRVLGSKGKEVKVVPSQIKEGVVLGAAALMIDKEFTIYD